MTPRHCILFMVALVVSVAIVPASSARADLSAAITTDLQHPASAVPGVQVSIGPPAGQETELGPVSTVIHVSTQTDAGSPLSGVMSDPASMLYTTAQPQNSINELAVMEAVKHAIAAGYTADAVAVNENVTGRPPETDPDLIVSFQDREITAQPPATMALADVKGQMQTALPPWASGASIDAIGDAAGERVVTVSLDLPGDAFRVLDVHGLVGILLEKQYDLAAAGADIGRVVVKVNDSTTHEPLYAAGADGTIGIQTFWYSPLVEGLIGEAPISPTTAADTASNAVQSLKP